MQGILWWAVAPRLAIIPKPKNPSPVLLPSAGLGFAYLGRYGAGCLKISFLGQTSMHLPQPVHLS